MVKQGQKVNILNLINGPKSSNFQLLKTVMAIVQLVSDSCLKHPVVVNENKIILILGGYLCFV